MSEENDLSRFLAVVGPSGSGKSSLVKAGLIPALRRGGLPGSENWFITSMTPGHQPLKEMAAALQRVAVQLPDDLPVMLAENERGLLSATQSILPAGDGAELALFIDQFEELFTLTEDESARSHFLQSLVTAVIDPASRLRVIMTLRADFTGHPLQYVDFGEMVSRRTEFVLPLTPDELETAITAPARNAGMTIETALVQQLIRQVYDQPGALPHLQYALTELFERRQGRLLTQDAYRQSGGVAGALANRAGQIFDSLRDTDQGIARQVFLRLVTLSETGEATRRRVLRSELEGLACLVEEPDGGRNRLAALLDQFGHYRLLTFDHDRITRSPTVEVAHEALLHAWPRLQAWLAESHADLVTQRLLNRAAAEWSEAARDPSFLARGARLEQLAAWRQNTSLALTQDEAGVPECQPGPTPRPNGQPPPPKKPVRNACCRTRRQLTRALMAALIVGLVAALALSVYAFSQRQERPPPGCRPAGCPGRDRIAKWLW